MKEENHLAPFTLVSNTPPGTCPTCAVKHDVEQPHNQQSLQYQYYFYNLNGRWPTWNDAMEHCSEEVKSVWLKGLREVGVDV